MPAHQSITDSTKIHEAKQIAGATTADAGKIITPSGVTSGVGVLRKLAVNELDPDGRTPWTGWANYADSVRTSSNKLSIAASARTKISIDASGSLTNLDGLPTGVSALWDTANNVITPAGLDDAYDIRFSCKGSLDSAAADQYVDFEVDVGGSIGVLWAETRSMINDTSEHSFVFNGALFTGSTFLANGGSIYLTPSANSKFWDFRLLIVRTHRGE